MAKNELFNTATSANSTTIGLKKSVTKKTKPSNLNAFVFPTVEKIPSVIKPVDCNNNIQTMGKVVEGFKSMKENTDLFVNLGSKCNSSIIRVVWKDLSMEVEATKPSATVKSTERMNIGTMSPRKAEINFETIQSCCSPESGFGSEHQYSPQNTSVVSTTDIPSIPVQLEPTYDEEFPQIASITSLASHSTFKAPNDTNSVSEKLEIPKTLQNPTTKHCNTINMRSQQPETRCNISKPTSSPQMQSRLLTTKPQMNFPFLHGSSRLYVHTDAETSKKSMRLDPDRYIEPSCHQTRLKLRGSSVVPDRSITNALPAFLNNRINQITTTSIKNCIRSLEAASLEGTGKLRGSSIALPTHNDDKSETMKNPPKSCFRKRIQNSPNSSDAKRSHDQPCKPDESKSKRSRTNVYETAKPAEDTKPDRPILHRKVDLPPPTTKKLTRIEQLRANLRQKEADLEKVRRSCGFIS